MLSIRKKIALSISAAMALTTCLYAKPYGDVYPIKVKQEETAQTDMTPKDSKARPDIINFYKKYQYNTHTSLNNAVLELAEKLLTSNKIKYEDMGEIAITSFVDLHKLNKTTNLGRTISESLYDELFIRGMNISEFRGQNSLAVNKNGEYYITRDVKLLSESVPNKYILVGTYTNVEGRLLINSRIINNTTGKIVASARTFYQSSDCKMMQNCKEPRKIKIITHKNKKQCNTINCVSKKTDKLHSQNKPSSKRMHLSMK